MDVFQFPKKDTLFESPDVNTCLLMKVYFLSSFWSTAQGKSTP